MEFTGVDYIVLVVDDLDRSLAFYTGLLGIPLGHRSGPYAQLATGRTRLSLFERGAMSEALHMPLRRPAEDAPAFEIGFKVANVDVAYVELVGRGAEVAVPPTTRPWGQRTAYLRDPDGHLVELAQDAVAESGTGIK